MVQATQLGGKLEEVWVVASDCCLVGSSRAGMSCTPTLKRARRRSGGMMSIGSRESRDGGIEERMERL